MIASIQSLVHRCRRQMPQFYEAPEPSVAAIAENEQCLGIYQNKEGSSVSFTTEGLRPTDGDLLRYRDMVAMRVIGEKSEASHLELILSDGSARVVEFNGGRERFRDVWQILRLLDRIRAVVQSDKPPTPDSPPS